MLSRLFNRPVVLALVSDMTLLIVANVATVYLFLKGSESVAQILLTYFVQTALIIGFYYKRIADSNMTQIVSLVLNRTSRSKQQTTMYSTSQEQFFYLLVFVVPLAFVFFIIGGGIINGTDLGLNLAYNSINYGSVAIASSLFLLHHVGSCVLATWWYKTGRIAEITIPYKKLVIRVYIIFGLMFVLPAVIKNNPESYLFYVFIAFKTLLDVVLSSSYALFKSLKNNE